MKNKTRKLLNTEAKGLAFVFPAFVLLILFTLYPMLNTVGTSFFNWNLGGRKKYVGTYNYQKLFSSNEIFQVLKNTFLYVIIIVPITMVIGFILAMMIKKKSKVNVVYRTMIFTPHIASMVGLSVVWLYIFNPQYGVLNKVISIFGFSPLRWVNETSTALISICIVTIWRMIGYDVIVFMGAIQNIPLDIIEASHIDGASQFKSIKSIILPLVSPSSFMLFILNSVSVLKLFTSIENMTGGGPGTSTTNLVMMLYNYAFRRYQMGMASAIAVVLFVIILIINLFQMYLEKYVNYDI